MDLGNRELWVAQVQGIGYTLENLCIPNNPAQITISRDNAVKEFEYQLGTDWKSQLHTLKMDHFYITTVKLYSLMQKGIVEGPHQMLLLNNLLIPDSDRCKGYGTKALHEIESFAREHGFTYVFSDLYDLEDELFFQKRGYIDLGHTVWGKNLLKE